MLSKLKDRGVQVAYILLACLSLLPQVSAAQALVSGAIFGVVAGNPYRLRTVVLTTWLLQASIVCLGAGMDLGVVGRAGMAGFGYTFFGIALTLALGALLGRLFGIEDEMACLLSVGTAICGGSAIAAV